MPLTYVGAGGLFTHLGKLIARIDSYATLASTTLPADLTTLVTSFGTLWLPPEGIASFYAGLQDSASGWRRGLARYCDTRLLDPATVLSQLSSPLAAGSGLGELLPALRRQMILDSQTVDASTCTAGTVAAASGNVGTGTAAVTLVLDGYNGPASGVAANPYYAGVASELCVPSETVTLECVADSAMDGLAVGSEVWSWTGGPAYPDLDWHSEGSGRGPTLYTDTGTAANLLANGGFSTWSSNVPTSWTLSAGTAGVDLLQDVTAAKFVGGGAATITLKQTLSRLSYTGGRRYLASVLAKQTGAAAGTLTVGLSGATTVVNCTALTGSYTPVNLSVPISSPVPDPLELTFTVAGLGGGGSVWLATPSLAPVTYWGGAGVNVLAGTTAWRRGDRLTFTLANNVAGLFSDFFRRHYRVQLPSDAVGGETIADSLVV